MPLLPYICSADERFRFFYRYYKMNKLILCLLVLTTLVCSSLYAQPAPSQRQDTLPKFAVKNAGNNRIVVSWTNTFKTIRQISIQRSYDSLKNYKTILTVPDPTTLQNGYVDTKAPNDHMFYRIYLMLEKGIYMFSDVKRPAYDTLSKAAADYSLKKGISINGSIDKIGGPDSLSAIPNMGISNGNKPNVFTPSVHVYTYKDGYVRINLPDDKDKKYNIKFFEEDGSFLFELKDIKERTFKIDKTNFYHAGWFKFELFENGKLIEKHKFFLQKEF
jgi:hypothetical protein